MKDGIGIVIIGRNEGERLVRSLASVGHAYPLVYVDSGSSDNSIQAARAAGANVVVLDMSIPFSAARARNAGFARLMEIAPATQWIQFIDGDCEIVAGWLELAAQELASNLELAAVCGRLCERFPQASIYNQFCNVEWDAPPGITDACGGIAMYRVEYFQAVGGFDDSVIAGEEPELCQRLRGRGWKIQRLGDEMAWHDAAMTQFGQWWKRQFRSGYNGLDVARRFGLKPFGKFARSAWVWTLGPLGLIIILCILGNWWWGWRGVAIAIIAVILMLFLQAFRIGRCKRGMRILYGMMTLLSKWAQLLGQLEYYLDRRRGLTGRLIEYKKGLPTEVLTSAPKLAKETEG